MEKVRENGDSEENRGLDVTCARIKLEKENKKEKEEKRGKGDEIERTEF